MTELAGGLTCLWLGMVLAISFLEAPLKFRAPGVTVPIGLGIGRLVFRALNRAEVVLAVLVAAGIAVSPVRWPVYLAGGAAAVVLLAQLVAVRPPLNRRSDRVLAGETVPRSRAHLAYIVLEAVKVLALVAMAALLLTPAG
ncbi:hypothetical protein [Amycolatopsis thermophila]|uniref:Transmembrane protein n=1 Tax=Amycolatopsis thermophila TaxID=206084 RepID=A0ABU0F2J0_9PSEU|nr:hypothetical protein [Amycolatopsis thermophila]MDQ0381794.1 hypothetical protein [Amycolatopsis thermophila]